MTRPGSPLTRARSAWHELEPVALPLNVTATCWERSVHDGILRALLSDDPEGWHLSVSHAPAGAKRAPRYPTWDELADARYTLAPPEVDFVMHLPPPAEYVAVHETTFHLHQHPPRPT